MKRNFYSYKRSINKSSSLSVASRRRLSPGVWKKGQNEWQAANRRLRTEILCRDSASSKYLNITLTKVKGPRHPTGHT